jgi:hypothetical protein
MLRIARKPEKNNQLHVRSAAGSDNPIEGRVTPRRHTRTTGRDGHETGMIKLTVAVAVVGMAAAAGRPRASTPGGGTMAGSGRSSATTAPRLSCGPPDATGRPRPPHPPVVRDHRTPPVVRDHRTRPLCGTTGRHRSSATPHTPPVVRDDRTPPVVAITAPRLSCGTTGRHRSSATTAPRLSCGTTGRPDAGDRGITVAPPGLPIARA